MITLEFNGDTVILTPNQYRETFEILNVGASHNLNRDMNKLVRNKRGETGGVRFVYPMVWENTEQNDLKKIADFRNNSNNANPMILTIPNGEQMACVFMPEENAFSFEQADVTEDNKILYNGTIILIGIERMC